ncbi:MAG: 30S ribosomal protein S8 [Candidatus Aenigmatarchaeota archaeon]|nr:MAG: 30S ribosomal protein S8 [Candidatus Aenigmarchaeota archaeon]
MRHDIIADVFSVIKNAEDIGKTECVTPASSLIKNILLIMQKERYIGEFEHIDDGRGGRFRIKLLGKINKCGAIKPRFSVPRAEFIRWEKRFLPAASLGLLLVSTSGGVISHKDAKKKGTGGKLIGYVY